MGLKAYSPSKLRKRAAANKTEHSVSNEIHEDIDIVKKQLNDKPDGHIALKHKLAFTAVTVMSFFITFYKIWFPAQVVFDEVHFGKFAGYYLQRVFFFDVHPPLAKLMFAAVGYMSGFNGIYNFSNIGESYAENHVPYLPLRALPASLNVLCVMLVYSIMKESGSSVLTCFLTASLYLFDNAFIGQNRLILLDSILLFYMLCSVYSYVKFRKYRHAPFSASWWSWLTITGVSMALTLSVKMIGLFVVASIGIAVVMDLWDLLDIKHRLSTKQLAQHFGARVLGLIFVPIVIYLFWFYVHFAILSLSGPGDGLMSVRFRNSLGNNPARLLSLDIQYNQSIRLQHKDTQAFLHSYNFTYPAQYQDGRYSSRGTQVVGNTTPDLNSYWRILPTNGSHSNHVQHHDIIRLEHIGTGRVLLTHDVASPWTPTNQEFTTVPNTEHRYNETLFKVVLSDRTNGKNWRTHMNTVNLVHVKTNVGIWCNNKNLPEWGHFHLEVNGNKRTMESKNLWTATDILGVNATEVNLKSAKQVKPMHFFAKFWELQVKMIQQNNQLTAPHPYKSGPLSWPLMIRGINYWTDFKNSQQIYMTGNIVGWWGGLVCIALYCAVSVLDLSFKKRGISFLKSTSRVRLNRTGGFFLLLWSLHYFPFFLMGRSLYLHHYLPAMACNYLLIGSIFEYIFIRGVNSPISYQPAEKKLTLDRAKSTVKSFVAAAVILGMQLIVFLFLAPMTYGTPAMTRDEATRRRVLSSWDVQFADPT